MTEPLVLQPLDGLTDRLLMKLGGQLARELDLDVHVAPARPVPAPIDPLRHQYDAAAVVGRLAARRRDGEPYTLAVTTVDLFAPGLNFVFGLAEPASRVAVVSMARLASTSPRVIEERLTKEATHEVGHLLGLSHCPNYCVMRFSLSLRGVDAKPAELCDACRVRAGLSPHRVHTGAP